MHLVADARHIEPLQRAHRILGLAIRVAECREIELADKGLRRLMHRMRIERCLDEPGPPGIDGQRRATVDDAIKIMPLLLLKRFIICYIIYARNQIIICLN